MNALVLADDALGRAGRAAAGQHDRVVVGAHAHARVGRWPACVRSRSLPPHVARGQRDAMAFLRLLEEREEQRQHGSGSIP